MVRYLIKAIWALVAFAVVLMSGIMAAKAVEYAISGVKPGIPPAAGLSALIASVAAAIGAWRKAPEPAWFAFAIATRDRRIFIAALVTWWVVAGVLMSETSFMRPTIDRLRWYGYFSDVARITAVLVMPPAVYVAILRLWAWARRSQ